MKIIEPCCAPRQLMGLRRAIAGGGTMAFAGYGDLSLAELLPAILTRYSETELLIAAPSLPDLACDVIGRWMRKTWARMDGQGRLDAVSRLTLVTSVALSPAVEEWLGTGAFGGRLTVMDREQADTAILLPDFAVTGPVNMRYGNPFTAEATTDPEKVKALWEKYAKVTETTEETEAAEETEATETERPEPKRKGGRRARESAAEPAAEDAAV